jgi:hypothetical protein
MLHSLICSISRTPAMHHSLVGSISRALIMHHGFICRTSRAPAHASQLHLKHQLRINHASAISESYNNIETVAILLHRSISKFFLLSSLHQPFPVILSFPSQFVTSHSLVILPFPSHFVTSHSPVILSQSNTLNTASV